MFRSNARFGGRLIRISSALKHERFSSKQVAESADYLPITSFGFKEVEKETDWKKPGGAKVGGTVRRMEARRRYPKAPPAPPQPAAPAAAAAARRARRARRRARAAE